MSFIDDVKSRLARRQDELPKLIQPERSLVQDLSDIAKLLELVELYEAALGKIAKAPEWKFEATSGDQLFGTYSFATISPALEALTDGERIKNDPR